METNSSGEQSGQGAGTSGAQGPSVGTSASANPNNPNLAGAKGASSIIELSEDSMVKLPGAKDPVRYGDHYRGFQSEFTKRAQEAANLRREKQQLQQQLQDHQRRLQGQQQQQSQTPNKLQALAGQLKSLTYLNGEQASGVVAQVMEHFGEYDRDLQQRDMALALMYKQLKEMGTTLQTLNGQHTSTQFEGKIAKFVKDAGLPEGATKWAQELYLAYEGNDLDREFPRIMKERWEEIAGLHKAAEKQRVEQARRVPFVPGQGGNGSASKPLSFKPNASSKEIADAFWPTMVNGETET